MRGSEFSSRLLNSSLVRKSTGEDPGTWGPGGSRDPEGPRLPAQPLPSPSQNFWGRKAEKFSRPLPNFGSSPDPGRDCENLQSAACGDLENCQNARSSFLHSGSRGGRSGAWLQEFSSPDPGDKDSRPYPPTHGTICKASFPVGKLSRLFSANSGEYKNRIALSIFFSHVSTFFVWIGHFGFTLRNLGPRML